MAGAPVAHGGHSMWAQCSSMRCLMPCAMPLCPAAGLLLVRLGVLMTWASRRHAGSCVGRRMGLKHSRPPPSLLPTDAAQPPLLCMLCTQGSARRSACPPPTSAPPHPNRTTSPCHRQPTPAPTPPPPSPAPHRRPTRNIIMVALAALLCLAFFVGVYIQRPPTPPADKPASASAV